MNTVLTCQLQSSLCVCAFVHFRGVCSASVWHQKTQRKNGRMRPAPCRVQPCSHNCSSNWTCRLHCWQGGLLPFCFSLSKCVRGMRGRLVHGGKVSDKCVFSVEKSQFYSFIHRFQYISLNCILPRSGEGVKWRGCIRHFKQQLDCALLCVCKNNWQT